MDLDSRFDEIHKALTEGCSEDYIVSRGEYLSAILVAAYLGYDFVDTQPLIRFNSKGRLLPEETNQALSEELAKHERAVLPGFYGGYQDSGEICLLSRGGSDVTGSLVARATGSDIYENWTDVSGLLMADPRIIDNPKPIEHISYRELRELSYMGASVLHEEAVFPVRLANPDQHPQHECAGRSRYHYHDGKLLQQRPRPVRHRGQAALHRHLHL